MYKTLVLHQDKLCCFDFGLWTLMASSPPPSMRLAVGISMAEAAD